MNHSEKMFLKPNVVIEPLVNYWYAWSHLVSPATAAMNIVERHLKIIDSFILAPHAHELAVRNAKMRGGPFMDIPGNKVKAVERLKAETLSGQNDLIQLAVAIKELNKLLENAEKGFSLEGLYDKVPEILRGYVELVYDLNNNASFRFYEKLLYKSKYYDPVHQSIVLWVAANDERPFVLSTPRIDLDDKAIIHQQIPFASKGIDQLSAMKRISGSYCDIRSCFDVPSNKEGLFESFFTSQAPPIYEKYSGDKIRMRYFGHACILIETEDTSILIDPIISYYGYHHEVNRFSHMHLPDHIDYVLFTHNHQDHILFETILPLRHKVFRFVVPPSYSGALQDPNLKLMFQYIGFENVIEAGEMETLRFSDCAITGVPFIGEHCDLNIQSKLCYHIQFEEFSVLFMADSCNLENRIYEHIHAEIGDVDVIFLGMECEGAPLSWLYGPLMPKKLEQRNDQSRRLAGSNFERGKGLVEIFNPLELYIYAMGQEPWLEYISSIRYTPDSHPIVQSNKLIQWCSERNITAERLFGEKEILYSKRKDQATGSLVF
jgi:L-ascorbate metabolism protein UlaG (beta-lactamase superfamily)